MTTTSNPRKSAVLLLAHGSPNSPDEVPEFLLKVTGGRPLPPAVVDEVKHRYGLIGSSPLTCWTLEQRDLLAEELARHGRLADFYELFEDSSSLAAS